MPDEMHVDEESGIIKVRSYGVVSAEDIAASMDRTRKIMQQKGIKKVLVDTRDQEKMPGTVDVFGLFSTLPHDIRAALVVKSDQATADGQRFAETVSQNRGIQVNIFPSEDDALKWLADATD